MTELLVVVGIFAAIGAVIYLFEQLPSKGVDLNWKPPADGSLDDRPWEDSRY